jgi:hypothetical protein
MADGLTMEELQTEAAAKQRAFESQQAKPSTSGRGKDTGLKVLLPFPAVARGLTNTTVSPFKPGPRDDAVL